MNRDQLVELYFLILATWDSPRPYALLCLAGDLESEVDGWLHPPGRHEATARNVIKG